MGGEIGLVSLRSQERPIWDNYAYISLEIIRVNKHLRGVFVYIVSQQQMMNWVSVKLVVNGQSNRTGNKIIKKI